MNIHDKNKMVRRRKFRIGNRITGTAERPRLCVFRSNKHIYAQIVDDISGLTLASASTKGKELRGQLDKTGNCEAAKAVGEAIAKQATGVGIKCVKFDRNRYRYHGRVKALAEAAREAGLVF